LLAARSLIALAYAALHRTPFIASLLTALAPRLPLSAIEQIYEYQPALIHAKTMVIDGMLATVGSTNLDNRSFALNEEIDLVVHDAGIARQLETSFAEDLNHSTEVTYEAWKSRPLSEKILDLFTLLIEEEL